MEEVEESTGNWKVMIFVILMMSIFGFEAMTFAMWKLYRCFRDSYMHLKNTLGDRVDGAELRIVEIERMFDQVEGDNERI